MEVWLCAAADGEGPFMPASPRTQQITCSGCSERFEATPVADGPSQTPCPYCGQLNEVPEEAEPGSAQGREVAHVGPDGLIRVKCTGCGFRIKAPPEYSGKRGRCPKCKAEIFMPWVSAEEVKQATGVHAMSEDGSADTGEEPTSAMAQEPTSAVISPIPPEASELPGADDGLDPESYSHITPEQLEEIERRHKARRKKEAKDPNVASHYSGQGLSRHANKSGGNGSENGARRSSSKREPPNTEPTTWLKQNLAVVVPVTVVVVLLGVGGGLFLLMGGGPDDAVPEGPPRYAYDLNTEEILVVPSSRIPPFETDSGYLPNGRFAGVFAQVYGCGGCHPDNLRIAWLEQYSSAAKQARLEYREQPDPKPPFEPIDGGRQIRTLDGDWVSTDTQRAEEIRDSLGADCPEDQSATVCRPPRE